MFDDDDDDDDDDTNKFVKWYHQAGFRNLKLP